jgi:SAM-dependent methyltransferase
MEFKKVYASKAGVYARYRWDYAPAAIQTLFEVSGLSKQASAVDIGAGTGILTKHLVSRLARVYAVEPDDEMRAFLADVPCEVLAGRSDVTGLPDGCVDLITVAQAIHWFEPEPTRAEFRRISRPGAWLALLRNYGTDPELDRALESVDTVENGVTLGSKALPWEKKGPEYYFGASGSLQKMTFPFVLHQNWEGMLGAAISTSYTPNPGQPGYAAFEAALHAVFERFQSNGGLELHGETELLLGKIS